MRVSIHKDTPARIARRTARYIVNEALDAFDTVAGRRHPLVPRRNRIFVGSGSFLQVGEEFRDLFIRYGDLRPHDRVLDVGCGQGRMAVPLTSYLTTGTYDGFDIVEDGVRWCQQRIAPRHPNFRFEHVAVWNGLYNPTGKQRGDTVRFPYDDSSFDFAFLTSVFTHLRPPEVIHYLDELRRVLVTGGRLFATAFLLYGTTNTTVVVNGRPRYRFTKPDGPARYADAVAEEAVGYEADWFRTAIMDSGFDTPRIYPGKWGGDASGTSFQDIIVARR